MNSELLYVIRNKNVYEKEERKRRQQELEALREDGVFRVALNKDIEAIKILFNDSEIEFIDVRIPEEFLSKFSSALYFEEMEEFKRRQLAVDRYRLYRKEIKF